MSRRPAKILLVLAMVLGLLSIPQSSQAAGLRITVSIRVWITITWTTTRASSPPAEASLSPTNVQVVPGATGSSSAVISWNPPATGAPSGGYTVRFSTYDKTAVPMGSATWSEYKYDAASNVNEMLVTDIAPSSLYQVNVTANDGYGTHYSATSNFCSPKYYTTDAGCILSASATKGSSSVIPSSNIDATSATWSLPDKAVKSGAINVTWSPADNVNSYLVQWYGEQYPLEYGEKSVPSGTTSTTISGLTGSKLYYVKVLALGGNSGFSESDKLSAYASPGATSAPVLSKGTDKCIGIGDFIIIGINSQTPNQSDKLSTKAYLTRFRKEGSTTWQNADQALKDKKRCLTESTYPDAKDRREYFLPDAISNFEFQVSEVSNTPSGGALAGDWSYSVWFGPNAVALNRTVTAQEESDGLSQKNNASAAARYNAYRTYLANVVAAQKA
ncbi:MAG: fibronectin type III domain-containing protein, partial [Actinomycetes bacterium]